LFDILETSKIPFEHNKAENTLLMKDTGSRILFRPVDEFERLRGTNLAWFGLDELTYTQEAAWLRLEGRLRDPQAHRLCGFAVWTPKGYDWVYRKFIAPGDSKAFGMVLAPPAENRFLLDKIPDFYNRLKDSYDENFYKQEVLGQYVNMRGTLVYGSFTREQNITETEVEPSAPVFWALDFNVDPMSSLIVQIINEKIHVLDEIVLRHATTRQACEEFLKRFPRHNKWIGICGDASGNKAQTTGASDYDIIREHFASQSNLEVRYKVPKANPTVRERINLTNSKLCSASGEVGLLIHPKCKELIQDFEQVSFREDSAEVDKDRDRMRTHLSDALGYLLWQECRPSAKIGEKPKPIL
jgi:hypothetical protein